MKVVYTLDPTAAAEPLSSVAMNELVLKSCKNCTAADSNQTSQYPYFITSFTGHSSTFCRSCPRTESNPHAGSSNAIAVISYEIESFSPVTLFSPIGGMSLSFNAMRM